MDADETDEQQAGRQPLADRRISRLSLPRQARRSTADWSGERAAIYCRISHADDDDQTGVDRQERICRDTAERLSLMVPSHLVFVDNNRSAWKRNRKRPGWDALLEAVGNGQVRHILTYHPDRLMRQPHDLEQLLQLADQHDITLHGQANRRDLADPDDRFFLRIKGAPAARRGARPPRPGVRRDRRSRPVARRPRPQYAQRVKAPTSHRCRDSGGTGPDDRERRSVVAAGGCLSETYAHQPVRHTASPWLTVCGWGIRHGSS